MKQSYISPSLGIIYTQTNTVLCLSLTGGTEDVETSNLPGIPFEDVFPW